MTNSIVKLLALIAWVLGSVTWFLGGTDHGVFICLGAIYLEVLSIPRR